MSKFLFWRFFLYFAFTVFAAPIEYHTHWLLEFPTHPFVIALRDPLQHGELFFYSVILVTEALFRIEMHPEIPSRWEVHFFKGVLYLMFLPFFGYLIIGSHSQVYGLGVSIEIYNALVSLIVSAVVFVYMHKLDSIENVTTPVLLIKGS